MISQCSFQVAGTLKTIKLGRDDHFTADIRLKWKVDEFYIIGTFEKE